MLGRLLVQAYCIFERSFWICLEVPIQKQNWAGCRKIDGVFAFSGELEFGVPVANACGQRIREPVA